MNISRSDTFILRHQLFGAFLLRCFPFNIQPYFIIIEPLVMKKILQHQTIFSNKYQKHFGASSYFTIFCVFMMLVLGSFSLLIWSKWGNSFSTTFCTASSEKGAWQVLTMETSEYLRSLAVSRMEKFYFFYKWFSWAHAQTL